MEPVTNLEHLQAFVEVTAQHWRDSVCGICAATGARPRCRVHFREDLARGSADLAEQTAWRRAPLRFAGSLREST